MNVAVILAGGRGVRFGGRLPKQFALAQGRPVLAYTLEAFQNAPEIDAIEVVCRGEYEPLVRKIAREAGADKLRWIAPAGENCPRSIKSGFAALRDALSPENNVVLHMAVSPLVSRGDIARALAVCGEKGCCFTMHPVLVCLSRGGGEGWADRDAPKEDFVELNTPWAFRYGEVLALYDDLDRRGAALSDRDYTLGLWLASGRRAWYARGDDPGRLKITTAHDLDIFEGLLLLKRERGERI